MKADIIKKIISFALLFLLIISFTTSILVSTMKFTILNKQYVISTMEQNNYYSKTYNTIIEKFKDNTVQSGLEESVLDGIITEKQVEEDTIIMLENIYENTETKIDTEIVKTRLKEKINQIIENNNKRVTQDEQVAIEIYVNTIGNIYEDGILYKTNYIDTVKNIMTKVIKASSIVNGISIILTIALIIIIGVINKKESLKYYSIGLISSGILLFVPKIVENIHINTHNILLFNLNFSAVVIDLVENTFMNMVVFGIILLVLGVILNIFATMKIENKENITKY